ncbi:MAG: GDSL-type esterase/lipase family protein, partial [Bacteroidota bacterium]
MSKSYCYIFLFFLFLDSHISAQSIPVTDNKYAATYSFIQPVFNRIQNTAGLDSFYYKLYNLKKTGKGIVSIVHIGDSHIQADFLSGVVRNGLQQFFGNAGRGLVFPYQLAQSNAPADINSSSNTKWQFNRVAHPEIPIVPGVSGYGIKTATSGASISFSLKPDGSGPQLFNRLKFFTDSNVSNSWLVQAENNSAPFLIKKENDSLLYSEILLQESAGNFSLASLPSDNTKEFYGVSLENSNPGILYHTIGVNGARYDHYNIAPLFWKQLAALHADLFIISLGTNEAQATSFNETDLQRQVSLFIQQLSIAAPNAAVLITTAADSYKHRKPNAVLRQINLSLVNYCNTNSIPAWDMYRTTNGYGSAYSWSKRGLMNRDKIHFTAEGYRIQGNLLFNALAKGYNNFISNY